MQNKQLIISLILISTLAVAVCVIFFRLSAIERQIGAIEEKAATDAADKNVGATAAKTNQTQRKTKNVEIVITDEGFLPSGFQMGLKDVVTVLITNQGKLRHSFAIDDPKIDSGAIEPGQTKTLTLDKQFAQPVELKYYSNIAGDSADTFKGTIMVF